MVESLILPSYKQGFARGSLSMRPNLWKGLVGCWKPSLGCTGINTLFDISGYGNHGTLSSITIADWRITSDGYTIHLNSSDSDSKVDDRIDTNTHILTGYPLTIVSLLVYDGTITLEDRRTIASQRDSGNFDFQFRVNDSGNVLSFLGSNTSQNSSLALSAGTKYFVAVVVNATGNCTFYKNLESDTPGGTPLTFDNDSSLNFLIGSKDVSTATDCDPWRNKIYYILAYNRALSTSELKDIYQYPNAMFQFRDRAIGRVPAVVAGTTILTLPVKNYMRNLITR